MDIASMLEVQVNEVKEVDSKENVTPKEFLPSTTNVPAPISDEEYNVYKLMFGNDISAVRFHRLHCTACDVHIGSAPADASNMFEHPILHTLLCSRCRDFYGDGTFEQGDDATDMFCRWCANGGNLYCCSFCSNTFCYKCIKRNFDPVLRKKIEADERWKCFVCDPRDLYTARGTCWALLQYVQTANRLLQNNSKLTQEELEEAMNADESKCCPRKKGRKRRKNGANSEDEDTTYMPQQIVQNVSKRRKRGRGRPRLSNGSNLRMTNKILGGMLEDSIDQNEIPPSLLSCEQTMVECENATVSADGRIIAQNPTSPAQHTLTPTCAPQQTMCSTPIVNVITNPRYIQPAPPITPLRHIPTSMNHSNQMNHINLYQTVHPVVTPMVTIPNQSVSVLNRSRLSNNKPSSQTPPTAASTSIIEIESDPEDVAVVRMSQTLRPIKPSTSKKAVPVALVSSKDNYDSARRQELEDKRNDKTLNQRLIPHSKDVDRILVNLRKKFQGWFEMSKRDELKKYGLNHARRLIKQFHREIRDTVTQLAHINDRIVREYNRWKRYQMKVDGSQSLGRNDIVKKGKREDIPLHMTCTNESESDSDTGSEIEYSIMYPSELVGTTNAVDGIGLFKPRETVDRAVGVGSALLVDKSVQIYDNELQDYDKCIRHSTSKVANQQVEKTNNTQESSTQHADKQFRNYEEHFIQFLQSQSLEVENAKELPDPNETSLKDLIEANSPFVSEMLETMDKSATPSRSNSTISIRKESELKSPAPRTTNSISCRKVEDLVKPFSDVNDDSNKKTVPNEPTNGNVLQKQAEIKRGHCSTSDKSSVASILKTEQSLRRTDAADSESSNEDDDCTIIDD